MCPTPSQAQRFVHVVYNNKNWKQPKYSPLEDALYKLQYMEGGSRGTIKWKNLSYKTTCTLTHFDLK